MDRWTWRQPRFRGAADQRAQRATRWCERTVQRLARLAAARGRPISPQDQRRMRMRREALVLVDANDESRSRDE